MVKPEKLYQATNGGLDIIALHFPEARECARLNRPFKMRSGERTPSARLKLFKGVWKVTDFGGDGRAIDPIQIHMDEKGISFPEAILDLSAIFNVTDELNRSVNRPEVRKQPATSEQVDGSTDWEIDQEFTDDECAVMGPRVKPEHLRSLHWFRVKRLSSVKNREVTHKFSNANYPIFMRECWFANSEGKSDRFYKIYEPLNVDKAWRFQYQPKNKKPQSYVNGLFELEKAWKKFNDDEEAAFNRDAANEGKPYKTKKLPEAIICSGERDAICVRSLGYHPLWFNSETYKVTDEEWKKINRFVETVYNIPDIDTTGKIKGTELALRFIELHTVWLPDKLKSYRDRRGNPRKDFRDWMEIWKQNQDFRDLLELATPAKFWTAEWVATRGDDAKKKGRWKYRIDISCLHEFLNLNGFFALRDDHAPATQFVRIEGNIVTKVRPKEIRDFVHKWTVQAARPRDLRNLVLQDTSLNAASLESLKEVDPDFSSYTENSQFFYFPGYSVEVTGEKLIKHDNKSSAIGRYAWNTDIIEHNIKFLPDMFEISHPEGSIKNEDFDIDIKNNSSNYLRYLINSSRIYWRKELENGVEGISEEENERYAADHKFDIAGPRLSEAEIQEQKQCLISKIFTIGFILHRFKSPSRAWAPFIMDNLVGENDQCNGRSGKSFMLRALSNFTGWLKISGRNPKLLDNNFAFEQITKELGIVTVDDCDEYFPFKQFYDNITSDITINTKNVSAYNMCYEDSPKFAFTTNYVPKEFDPSSVGRMLFVVFSDYYHEKTEDNDYLERRSIRDDFGKDLMSSQYSEAEWEADINFVLQCVKFYLSVSKENIKIEPQMSNIIFRKFLRDMSENFKDWAEGYFSIDEKGFGEHVNCEVVREDAFNDYKRFSGVSKITMQKFSKSLKGFCYTCDYVDCMNPKEMCNSGGRILRRVENPVTKQKEQREMIYIRTVQEAQKLKTPQPTQNELPL